ncbi:MAG: hypothetical protein O7C39_02695 [Bacteroidetes bacterium]|nr:hypothetical protein [Bacteroidota bacterium]
MKTVFIPATKTVDLIAKALNEEFPGTVFAVRLEDPVNVITDIRGVDVIWVDGPNRDEVETALERFQGMTWDPRTGVLEGRSHFVVDEEGNLTRVFYNVDYIFCDGPVSAV